MIAFTEQGLGIFFKGDIQTYEVEIVRLVLIGNQRRLIFMGKLK